MTIAVTARDAPRRLAFATMVVFAVWADFGFGIRSELIAPSETKIPAVNAAQRAPCVIASYSIDKTAGKFPPKKGVKERGNPPKRPGVGGAGKRTPCCTPKIAGFCWWSGAPTLGKWGIQK